MHKAFAIKAFEMSRGLIGAFRKLRSHPRQQVVQTAGLCAAVRPVELLQKKLRKSKIIRH